MNKPTFNTAGLPANQQGYSVLELMVASVIGLVVLSGAVTVFTGNKSSQELSSGMARIQESGRVALDILSNDIRLAGFQGCTDGSIAPNVLANNGPTITLPRGALWGGEYNGSSWTPAQHADLAAATVVPKDDTDVIYVQHGSGRTTILADSMIGTTGPISLALNPDQLEGGDLMIISDCSHADIFRATSVAGAAGNNVTVNFAAGGANSSATLSNAYKISGAGADRVSDPMRVMRFESNAYFVADSNRDTPGGQDIFSLFLLDTTTLDTPAVPVELVEGVEHMQILYGQRLPSGDIQYLTANNAALNIDDVVSVQIGLLVATTDSVTNNDDDRTYLVANERIGPPASSETLKHGGGRLMRATFNTTIQLRNRNL